MAWGGWATRRARPVIGTKGVKFDAALVEPNTNRRINNNKQIIINNKINKKKKKKRNQALPRGTLAVIPLDASSEECVDRAASLPRTRDPASLAHGWRRIRCVGWAVGWVGWHVGWLVPSPCRPSIDGRRATRRGARRPHVHQGDHPGSLSLPTPSPSPLAPRRPRSSPLPSAHFGSSNRQSPSQY